MTYKEVATMVSSIGLPYAYYQFPNGTEQNPPFVCFLYTDSDDFYADNSNFARIRPLAIELYTDNKDFTLEGTVESVLNSNGLPYRKTETYIDTEHMYQIAYSVEVLITDEITEENNG